MRLSISIKMIIATTLLISGIVFLFGLLSALAGEPSWTRTALLGALFVLVGTALSIVQAIGIARPLKALSFRADQIARGDLSTRVEIDSDDEIGQLGKSFNHMADRLAILLHETAERATLEKELAVARSIQQMLVPPSGAITRRHIEIAGYFQPAAQCGGDWWTTHDLPDGRVLIAVGDVTGHGVPAAMVTALAKSACDVICATEGTHLGPGRILSVMNRALLDSTQRKYSMSCAAAVWDPAQTCLTFSNAGHRFAYLISDGKLHSLIARGNRLGDAADSKYEEVTRSLAPGDLIVWYSDGIFECENPAGEQLGEKRFRLALERVAGADVAKVVADLAKVAEEFSSGRPPKDDITLVAARTIRGA